MSIGKLIDLELHIDDRGTLNEIFRSDTPYFSEFGQVYIIKNHSRNTVRAFHCHKRKEDYFSVTSGVALVILVKDGKVERYTMSASKPQLLVIPPEVYHGWKSLTDNTHLLNIVTEPFHTDDPDDHRISWDSFGEDIWQVKHR